LNVMLLVIAAYLLGAVPFGLLIGRAHGVDVRTLGSRNIGATNVGRVVGRPWGYLCLALDILKGFVPTLLAALWLGGPRSGPPSQLAILLVALAAVLGHVFPVYLRFRGGKGVATTIGVALGVWPHYTLAMGVALVAYGLVRWTTRTVSLGSLTLALVFPSAHLAHMEWTGVPLREHWPLQLVAALLGLLIIARHHENIRRLLTGRELAPVAGRDACAPTKPDPGDTP